MLPPELLTTLPSYICILCIVPFPALGPVPVRLKAAPYALFVWSLPTGWESVFAELWDLTAFFVFQAQLISFPTPPQFTIHRYR